VEQGTIGADELRRELRNRRGRTWIWAVVGRSVDGIAPLLHALIVVGIRPPGWTEKTWDYGECSFISTSLSSVGLASALYSERADVFMLGSTSVRFEPMGENVSSVRKPSLALYDELTLPWPSVAYNIILSNRNSAFVPNGYLIGEGDAPSFPTFGAAFSAFYRGNFVVSGTSSPQLGEVSIRIADGRARIGRVRVRPTSLEVWVGGRALRGARLELNGAENRASVELERACRITFPLITGLPTDAWLWLKEGNQWRDFRALSWEGARISNVETELPRDPLAELSLLAAQGEGSHLEYKVKLPDNQGEKRNIFKTVVAFANGDGGTILFGVDDGGELLGIDDELPVARRRLNDLLRDLVDPPPQARIDARALDGRNFLVLEVSGNGGSLHALTLDKNKPEYFVRRDGTTFYARPEELASVVRRTQLVSDPLPWSAT